MLNAFLKSGAVGAKTRVLYGRRLTPSQYSTLMSLHSVPEIARYLKSNTPYGELLSGVNEQMLHRGQLENILRRDLFHQYIKLHRYLSKGEQQVLQYLLHRSESQELLSFIRALSAGHPESYFFTMPEFFRTHSRIDFRALPSVKTPRELLQKLADTPYYRVLCPHLDRDGPVDFTAVEVALYTHHYTLLLKAIQTQLSGESREEMQTLICEQLDLLNISRILRLRIHFNYSPREIRLYLIPNGRKKSEDLINALLSAPGAEEMHKLLAESPYRSYLPPDGMEEPEKLYYRYLYRAARQRLHAPFPSVLWPLSYLYLKEIEIRNLINIIEGVRYQLPPEDIRRYQLIVI